MFLVFCLSNFKQYTPKCPSLYTLPLAKVLPQGQYMYIVSTKSPINPPPCHTHTMCDHQPPTVQMQPLEAICQYQIMSYWKYVGGDYIDRHISSYIAIHRSFLCFFFSKKVETKTIHKTIHKTHQKKCSVQYPVASPFVSITFGMTFLIWLM